MLVNSYYLFNRLLPVFFLSLYAAALRNETAETMSKHTTANFGIATGRNSGIIVVDVDPRNGGHKSINKLIAEYLARVIFNDEDIPLLVEKYRNYIKGAVDKSNGKLENMKKKVKDLDKQLENITNAIGKSGSLALITALDKLEKEKADLEEMIFLEEDRQNINDITEAQVREAYKKARQLYLDGGLDEKRQLINLYLQKVVIHKEHVEVIINVLPAFSGSNLWPHLKNVAKNGGGEGNRTPVRKNDHRSFSECSL